MGSMTQGAEEKSHSLWAGLLSKVVGEEVALENPIYFPPICQVEKPRHLPGESRRRD